MSGRKIEIKSLSFLFDSVEKVVKIKIIKMDDSMGESEFAGWRSSEEMESNEEMEIETTEEMAVDKMEEENISGLSADHKKVLAVVKNNDTEDGADIASDFSHLESKFRLLTEDISHMLLPKMSTIILKRILSGQRQTSRNSELAQRRRSRVFNYR